VRDARPDQAVHYSVDDEVGWRALETKLAGALRPQAITIHERMLDDERAAAITKYGLDFIVWDVERPDQVVDAMRRGASGIISHHLDVLGGLPAGEQSLLD
jgi:hypothetical protein